jgi:glycine/serine hydroxymethyltransferase
MTYQEIIERIESLPVEDQDDLFELIRKRRSPHSGGFANEQRRTEIAEVGERLRQAVKMGTAKSFDNVEDLKSYLFADDEE